MIYDSIEQELEQLCVEWEVDLKGIEELQNITSIRLCHYCGEPLTGQSQKYHIKCGNIVKKVTERDRKRNNPEKFRGATAKYRASRPLCTCCGRYPRATGNRFLCNLCYEHDGDGWKALHQEGVGA